VTAGRRLKSLSQMGIGRFYHYCRKDRMATSPVVNAVAAGHLVPMSPTVMPKKPTKQAPPLRSTMTCEMAFRTAATHYFRQLTAQQQGTSAGEAEAVHAMRIALTRLRATISLFSPMVTGREQMRLATELKWLHAHLGIVRDLDVALERMAKTRTPTGSKDGPWKQERAACQRHLTHALRSARYRRLVGDLAKWIEDGDWSKKTGKKATERRAQPAEQYCAEKLKRWRQKLLKKSSKLKQLGARKRHKVRLANKRLTYAFEAAEKLVPSSDISAQQATVKLLRKAQKSLGQLNDDARFGSLAADLGQRKMNGNEFLLDGKRKKRLLRRAVNAYNELAELKPFEMSNR
jgi:CHAD domain-containing protein